MEYDESEYIDDPAFEKYATYGGGGSGPKNGHYGCKHSEEAKKIMSLRKKGKQTWNKGIKGYKVHTEASKKSMSIKLSGSNNPKAILTEDIVKEIISLYLQKLDIENVGEVMRNGKPMSYVWAFSKKYAPIYGITPKALELLLTKKNWKNVWSEYEI